MLDLPDFALEVYLSKWEFVSKHMLCASDAEAMSIEELLSLGSEEDSAAFSDLSLGYIPTWGSDNLRQAIASTYDERSPGDVLCFAGAEEAMFWLMTELLGSGDHAVVTVPCYPSTESVPRAAGADITGVPLYVDGTWQFDLDAVRQAVRPSTRLIAVNFPHNPSGLIAGRSDFAELVEFCDRSGIRLLSDEVYRGIELDESLRLPQAADISPTAVSMNVMSKSYGLPGLRVGWLTCRDPSLLSRLERRKHYTSICNSAPSEMLAYIALKAKEQIHSRIRSIIAANVETFDDFFQKWEDLFRWQRPDGGTTALVEFLGDEGSEAMCAELVEKYGVLLLPGTVYRSPACQTDDNTFRIGLGRSDPGPALELFDQYLSSR